MNIKLCCGNTFMMEIKIISCYHLEQFHKLLCLYTLPLYFKVFHNTKATRGIKDLVRVTLQQGWLSIKLKIVKKYCHNNDLKGVKVRTNH